jgi:hypothetical protein
MNPSAEIALTLARAAGIIEERGWCQGNYEDEGGAVCLMGAVAKAAGVTSAPHMLTNPLVFDCDRALNDAINAGSSGEWENNEDWNDWPVRDKKEVIDLLEGVAWQHQITAEREAVLV